MSFGDEIMASGHALEAYTKTRRKVIICCRDGQPRWDELWKGLHWIVQPGENCEKTINIRNGPGCRAYIKYPFTRKLGCTYTGWRARDYVGAIEFTEVELDYAEFETVGRGPTVLIEPHISGDGNPNKQWGKYRWQALVDLLTSKKLKVVQVGPPGTRTLRGVRLIETPTFRLGAAVLCKVAARVLPEGGLHHACGALRLPAVVLYGGAVPPDLMGYPWHDNVSIGEACGRWMPCQHCQDMWAKIDPADIAKRTLQAVEESWPAQTQVPV